MDDALLVANLVYIGTLAIGGVLFIFFAMAFVITLFLAGFGQGVASLVGLMFRPLARLFEPGEAEGTTAVPAHPDYARAAVVAKADAILAAQKAALGAAAQAREAGSPGERLRPEPEDVPAQGVLPAAAQRLAITGKSAVAALGPHTGTQPILIGKAS